MSYIKTHMIARNLSDRLLLAHYDTDREHIHARQARQYFLCMLAQDSGLIPEVRPALVDLIENAIDDVHDMDVTFKDYAESVVDALLDHVVPMPMPEGDEQ